MPNNNYTDVGVVSTTLCFNKNAFDIVKLKRILVIIIIIIIFNMTSDKTQMKLQSVEWKLVSTCLYTKVV